MKYIKKILVTGIIFLLVFFLLGFAIVIYVLVPYPTRKIHKIEADNRIQIESYDGIILVSKLIKNNLNSHKWALLVHSYRTDHLTMERFGQFYINKGFNILYPDNRAHGNSGGIYIGMGYLDRLDLLSWIQYILSLDPDAEIIIHGLSMGASAALMLSSLPDNSLNNVKVIIADSGYSSAEKYLSDKLKQRFGLPSFPLIPIANIAFKVFAGYYLKDASAIESVRHSMIPTLIIHSKEDQSVHVSNAYNLYENLNSKKELLIVHGAEHGQSLNVDSINYWNTISNFILQFITID